ncbi:ATP-binding protein [Sphaerisporangium sp. NPDC049002]|uniref:ATP-binding protein n=1 Tax=Sphaerisporangium sp. NPDC049002 TaxID=3155392 RepID=UPI0033D500C8
MNPEDYDYDEARRRATESWIKEQIEDRLTRFYARRPRMFAVPGELHPDVAAWVDRVGQGEPVGSLVLTGNVGSGKTWTLWKIQETLIGGGYRGTVEIRAAHELKRLIAPPVDTAALDVLADADVMALDDVGSVRVSDWDADHLMALIDIRWSHRRPTILTSNTTELRPLLGDRVASRLAHNATTVKITGPDRRRGR